MGGRWLGYGLDFGPHHGYDDGFLLPPLEAIYRADFHGGQRVCPQLLHQVHLHMESVQASPPADALCELQITSETCVRMNSTA